MKQLVNVRWVLVLFGIFAHSPALPCSTAQDATAQAGIAAPVSSIPDQSVIAAGASLTLLSDEFKFTEGPISDKDGNVYFTDQPNDTIHRWTVEGKLETFLKPAGRSNGLFFDVDGSLLACADEKNELWSIDASGRHRVLVNLYKDKLLNGPNDLWVDSDGAIYFTDPYYKRPYWNRGETEQPVQGVYRVSPDRREVVRLLEDLVKPNGIIGDWEKRILYVADIGAGETYRYRIADDGTLVEKTLFCDAGSDGMTIDQDGNVYLTGRAGVTRYSPDGQLRETISVPKSWVANVTFGGPQHSVLFITAGNCLFSVQTKVRGLLPGESGDASQ